MEALILFAHGSRDPTWRAPFDAIVARVRARRPQADVSVAFLERASPALDEAVEAAIARGARGVRIVPMFLGLGGHLRHDMPKLVDAVRARHPAVSIAVMPSLGEAEDVLDAMAAWLAAMAVALAPGAYLACDVAWGSCWPCWRCRRTRSSTRAPRRSAARSSASSSSASASSRVRT